MASLYGGTGETVRSNVRGVTVRATRSGVHRIGKVSTLHYHDELEFLPVLSGRFVCQVGGVEYSATAGEVIFVNSGVPHSTFCYDEDTRTALLQFRVSDFQDSEISKIIKYSVRFQGLTDAPVKIIRDERIFRAISDILGENERLERAHDIFIRSSVLYILGLLYREGLLADYEQAYNSKGVQKILPALAYINECYQEDITLEGAAARLNFDPSYFCRIFKQAVGATFTEYLNFVRICKAERLLSRTDRSVLEISEAVGFSSVSYFNRIFKKYRNCSPKHYRLARYGES